MSAVNNLHYSVFVVWYAICYWRLTWRGVQTCGVKLSKTRFSERGCRIITLVSFSSRFWLHGAVLAVVEQRPALTVVFSHNREASFRNGSIKQLLTNYSTPQTKLVTSCTVISIFTSCTCGYLTSTDRCAEFINLQAIQWILPEWTLQIKRSQTLLTKTSI